ncbi:ImmA/IrrE family metallo-endopeptidase [Siphonobacter sp.]|uniref:ImmA/IrrE family metallo-endopeptidase n=1 Tax=Siphonobacter sp. TaxID=1869184 RepID=UPI003B3A7905
MPDSKYYDVERLLTEIFSQPEPDLRELFEKRILDLKLSNRAVQAELDIEYRALNGILDGTQKMVDLLALSRLADFLQMPVDKVVILLLYKLKKHHNQIIESSDKKDFILKHFDIVKLKKSGFLDNISDFSHIEEVIVKHLGLNSIFDYGKNSVTAAFSSGKPVPINEMTRIFWIESAATIFKHINNKYPYDRDALINYIPSIRWHTTDIKYGLYQVIRDLYKLGVTVIFQPYLTTLYVRGATISINNRPCIVITNYSVFYPSLWFTLIHELHHVLFDWEDIRINNFHISGELDVYDKREVEADTFAREYLFSTEKLKKASPQIDNQVFVKEMANAYDIHPSIIYANYCYTYKDVSEKLFAKYRKFIPDFIEAVKAIDNDYKEDSPWLNRFTAEEKAKKYEQSTFQGL